jgi:hypothetical protein
MALCGVMPGFFKAAKLGRKKGRMMVIRFVMGVNKAPLFCYVDEIFKIQQIRFLFQFQFFLNFD